MEHRRSPRYLLSLPLAVTRTGATWSAVAGVTRNISTTGVLFATSKALAGPVEYLITLTSDGLVTLRCIGNVVRAQELQHEHGMYEIAVTVERYEFVRVEKSISGVDGVSTPMRRFTIN